MFRVENLKKTFGGLMAVNEVSFTLNQGGDQLHYRTQRGR